MHPGLMKKFNETKAKKHLAQIEKHKQDQFEKERLEVLAKATKVLKAYFIDQEVQVYLVGSVNQAGKFNEQSDVDIVLKNFKGDRFEVWPELEKKIGHQIEVILYEKCNFQDHVDKYGLRVV